MRPPFHGRSFCRIHFKIEQNLELGHLVFVCQNQQNLPVTSGFIKNHASNYKLLPGYTSI